MAEVLAGAIWVQDRVRKVVLVHLANLPGGTVLLVEVCLDKVNQGFVIQTDWEVRHDVQETHSCPGAVRYLWRGAIQRHRMDGVVKDPPSRFFDWPRGQKSSHGS